VADNDKIRGRAIAAHEACWQLLEKPERTADEDRAMIRAAHESLSHWQIVGTFVEEQRGNWLVARAYIAVGTAEPALEYGRRTMEITAKHHDVLADFDRAFAEELMARTWALAGDLERARTHHTAARRLGEEIRDEADRREFFRQFEAEPWFGLDTVD
jgi:hypothetical protein